MTNVCITIDTEGDSANNPHSTFLGIKIIIPKLLELLCAYNIKATFFIQEDEICQIGSIFSSLWKSLEGHGHEIGYHAHGLIRCSPEKKESIITKGIQRLRTLGFNPVSFRGGRYHFNSYILNILEKNNIKYDSSVVPGLRECFSDGTARCDHTGVPHKPYFPSYKNHCKEGNSSILELPINRYPHLFHHGFGGILEGLERNEAILFDYFYEIRKDQLIIINLHFWHGLSFLVLKFARDETYGKIKRFALESMRKVASSNFLINGAYIPRFDNLLRHISKKNDVHFTTIKEAGESIIQSKLG